MNRLLVLVAFASTLALSSEARAVGVGADLGYSRLLGENGVNGFGADAYVRPPLGIPFVDVELQAGWHRFSDRGVTLSEVPLMAGARLNLPIPGITAFVGAHAGAMLQSGRVALNSSLALSSDDQNFAFNIGAGVAFLDLPLAKLGIAGWFYKVSDDAKTQLFTLGLSADFGL